MLPDLEEVLLSRGDDVGGKPIHHLRHPSGHLVFADRCKSQMNFTPNACSLTHMTSQLLRMVDNCPPSPCSANWICAPFRKRVCPLTWQPPSLRSTSVPWPVMTGCSLIV